MNIMFVNEIPILTGIDRTIRYQYLVCLDSHSADEIYKGIDKTFREYNKSGFLIKEIHCDREFKTIMDGVKYKLNVNMNYVAIGEYVTDDESNTCNIAERTYAYYHNLTYKDIPNVMLIYLAMVPTNK